MRPAAVVLLLAACAGGPPALDGGTIMRRPMYLVREPGFATAGADGIVFTGYLDENGTPAEGDRLLLVALDDTANRRCAAGPGLVTVTAGRFAVLLPGECRTAMIEGAASIEVTVETDAMPRIPIAVVPHALLADAVRWPNVQGIEPATRWPGTVPWESVEGAPDVAALVARVADLEATAKELTRPHGYVDTTPLGPVSVGGYGAADRLCDVNFAGTHVCTAPELVRSPKVHRAGWYATGVLTIGLNGKPIDDCAGFTDGTSGRLGQAWPGAPTLPVSCDVMLGFACCD